jgi:hypothetical protein
MSNELTDYNLPETAYTTFDAQSLKSLIIQRLNEQGTFTDQIYEGSNLSSFIDVIAYSYHVLLFYLNQTASESVFTESTIYENVNRIVKLLNYNPLGYQTSTLSFTVNATEDLVPGTYTIPRYTFVNNNSIVYSINKDISFTKYTTGNELIGVIGDNHLMYQGRWVESVPVEATGSNFEIVALALNGEDKHIDHFNVHVYVKHKDTGKYYEYKETPSLYLYKSEDLVFEKRLSEDLSYEIKFGNNINGRRLSPGDEIQVYYLESVGEEGTVGANFLDDSKLVIEGTTKFNTIMSDVRPQNIKYITLYNIEMLQLTNDTPSTSPQERESIDDIKQKAPVHYISQDRLVTLTDFNTHVAKNFDRILTSSLAVDNKTFLDGHFKYLLEDIGLNNPMTESRIMTNHLDYASPTTGNNVYIYAVPKITQSTSLQPMTSYLNPSQKSLILDDIRRLMMVSHQPIIMDPVYMAVNIATRDATELEVVDHIEHTYVEIKRESSVSRDDSAIIDQFVQVIVDFFSNTNVELGQKIEITELSQRLLSVEGVDEIATVRSDTGQRTAGLSLCIWNPVYVDEDVTITTQNLKLAYYKFPYLNNSFGLSDKIRVVS